MWSCLPSLHLPKLILHRIKDTRDPKEMGSFHLKPPFVVFIASTLLLSYNFCHADRNVERGWRCSEADNSTVGNSFQTKLNNILYSLASIVSLNIGFYKATAGKDFNEIYGLIQCRGDISAQDCTNCTGESIKVALHRCPESKSVVVWFTWCFLRYSDEMFFGVSEQYGVGTFDTNGVNDPSVLSKGFTFMGTLASTTPNQPLMFHTSVLEVGKSGKRYGMAQCTRDLSNVGSA